jgi:hypothetical protein
MLRVLTPVVLSGLAALTLAACTSNTQKCSGGKCEIDLSGKGATVTLGGEGGSDMKLVSASGNTAKVEIAGQPVTLTVGQPITLSNATLTLEEVEGEDDIQVKLDTTGFNQDGSTTEEQSGDDDSDKKKPKTTSKSN